jgi:hypothetical protein
VFAQWSKGFALIHLTTIRCSSRVSFLFFSSFNISFLIAGKFEKKIRTSFHYDQFVDDDDNNGEYPTQKVV